MANKPEVRMHPKKNWEEGNWRGRDEGRVEAEEWASKEEGDRGGITRAGCGEYKEMPAEFIEICKAERNVKHGISKRHIRKKYK